MNKEIIIIGAGGHAKVLIDCIKKSGLPILGATSLTKEQKTILGVKILGSDSVILEQDYRQIQLINGIGMLPGKAENVRQEIFERFKQAGFEFLTLIHPSVILAEEVILSEGVQVMAGAVLQPCVKIGENTIINTCASIDHDCMIGKHCHIAPGVTMSGGVIVHDNVHIGVGASVIQGITIGENAVIAAGAVVYKDVAAHDTYFS